MTGATGSASQQQTALACVMAFFRANVGTSASATYNQNFNTTNALPPVATKVTTVERGFSPSPDSTITAMVEDFDEPLETDYCAVTNKQCGANVTVRVGNVPDHDLTLKAGVISWNSSGSGVYFQSGWSSMNATEYQTLDLRLSRLDDVLNVAGRTNFSIQLVTDDGSFGGRLSSAVKFCQYGSLRGPVGGFKVDQSGNWQRKYHPVLQTVRIPLANFTNADLTKLRGVRFIFSSTPTGAIYVTNIRLAK